MSISAEASVRDLRALLDVVTAREDETSEEGLPRSVLSELAELIPCDQLSFFELDSKRQTTAFMQNLGANDDGAEERLFWLHYWDCLACCYPDRSGDARSVMMMSDFYTPRELHQLGMYADYLRPAGIERELMVCMPAGPGRTQRLVLFRGPGPDFTEADRAVLSLLRPHLREAYLDQYQRREMPYLTQRQQQLLELVAGGHTNVQIARRLEISEGTVRKHMENIFERLGVTSRAAAVAAATRALPQLTA